MQTIKYQIYIKQVFILNDWFDTEGDMVVLDSTVHVDEDNITDCGVNDDQEMIGD